METIKVSSAGLAINLVSATVLVVGEVSKPTGCCNASGRVQGALVRRSGSISVW